MAAEGRPGIQLKVVDACHSVFPLNKPFLLPGNCIVNVELYTYFVAHYRPCPEVCLALNNFEPIDRLKYCIEKKRLSIDMDMHLP